ncbi:hypothetical protein XFLAVUS301_23960 [Xanthobacter flavus]|uniref:Uncharacterized protein n=1 Tax=Xanthobacter flavus TaxID=281 RepID=A0A9W6CMU1_XANFL|nr:hypothetical protein XFLAVUS301_23960 [Xanthobacter flavus]
MPFTERTSQPKRHGPCEPETRAKPVMLASGVLGSTFPAETAARLMIGPAAIAVSVLFSGQKRPEGSRPEV